MILTYPIDVVYTNFASDTNNHYSGILDVLNSTPNITSLYAGLGVSIAGIFFYRLFYFGLYAYMVPKPKKNDKEFAKRFAIGYGVTVITGVLLYPLDTIRRRIMISSFVSGKSLGFFDCASSIIAKEGILCLYSGAMLNIGKGLLSAFGLTIFDVLITEIYSPTK